MYLVIGAAAIVAWVLTRDGQPVLVNGGVLAGGIGLMLFGAYSYQAGFDLEVDERDALVAATRAVGFPVGHASAQLGWRGLRSKPTWRILVYSSEEPPTKRASCSSTACTATCCSTSSRTTRKTGPNSNSRSAAQLRPGQPTERTIRLSNWATVQQPPLNVSAVRAIAPAESAEVLSVASPIFLPFTNNSTFTESRSRVQSIRMWLSPLTSLMIVLLSEANDVNAAFFEAPIVQKPVVGSMSAAYEPAWFW